MIIHDSRQISSPVNRSPRLYLWQIDSDVVELGDRPERNERTVVARSAGAPPRGAWILVLGTRDDGMPQVCAIGLTSNKQAISTGRSRVRIAPFHRMAEPILFKTLKVGIDRYASQALDEASEKDSLDTKGVTPRCAGVLLESIKSTSKEAVHFISELEKYFQDLHFHGNATTERVREAHDAGSLALKLAKISAPLPSTPPTASPHSPTGAAFDPSNSIQDLEDDMLADDLRRFDENSEIMRLASSASLVQKNQTRLLVVNVNRKLLEHVHGVDLVYYDLDRETATVVQYKRLSQGPSEEWIYTNKSELKKQIALMQTDERQPVKSVNDWRISPSPYFFKFMKTAKYDPSKNVLAGMYVPANYLKLGIETEAFNSGPKGGFRIGYNNCSYIPTTPFVELVAHSLIGTSKTDKPDLLEAVKLMAQTDQVVLALRSQVDIKQGEDLRPGGDGDGSVR